MCFLFTLKRKSNFYVMVIIIPTFIITALTITGIFGKRMSGDDFIGEVSLSLRIFPNIEFQVIPRFDFSNDNDCHVGDCSGLPSKDRSSSRPLLVSSAFVELYFNHFSGIPHNRRLSNGNLGPLSHNSSSYSLPANEEDQITRVVSKFTAFLSFEYKKICIFCSKPKEDEEENGKCFFGLLPKSMKAYMVIGYLNLLTKNNPLQTANLFFMLIFQAINFGSLYYILSFWK